MFEFLENLRFLVKEDWCLISLLMQEFNQIWIYCYKTLQTSHKYSDPHQLIIPSTVINNGRNAATSPVIVPAIHHFITFYYKYGLLKPVSLSSQSRLFRRSSRNVDTRKVHSKIISRILLSLRFKSLCQALNLKLV